MEFNFHILPENIVMAQDAISQMSLREVLLYTFIVEGRRGNLDLCDAIRIE